MLGRTTSNIGMIQSYVLLNRKLMSGQPLICVTSPELKPRLYVMAELMEVYLSANGGVECRGMMWSGR